MVPTGHGSTVTSRASFSNTFVVQEARSDFANSGIELTVPLVFDPSRKTLEL